MTAEGTLDDLYFAWLYGQVGSVRNRNPSRSYWQLLKQLYTKPFTWTVPNDDNRIEDGKDLRIEFEKTTGAERDQSWMDLDCSMLEMLIALGRRTAFESYGTSIDWFWTMLDNIGLRDFSDEKITKRKAVVIDDIITTVIDRTYSPSGEGGLFPLQHPEQDQRDVEIWYQMSSYLLEAGVV